MMNKMKNEKIFDRQDGMALLMVTGAVALMAFILAEFTFKTNLNKIRIYNISDQLQARLSAEAGLNFALSKFRIYKEARNKVEKNPTLKESIQPSIMETIVTQPFIFPVVLPKTANIIQRSALEDFKKENLLRGELRLSITPIRGFLNPNNLRFNPNEEDDTENNAPPSGVAPTDEEPKKTAKSVFEFTEKKFIDTLTNAIEEKKEEDEIFANQYSNLSPALLVKELKYVVNDEGKFEDPERGEIEALYSAVDIRPKHAPMTSVEEMYLLQGWDDAIINLIRDQISVHEVGIIQANQLTEAQLKLLFPDITPSQLEEFFTHRDGNSQKEIEANPFNSFDDFQNVMVQKVGLEASVFSEKVQELAKAGLRFDVAGQLFLVTSIGLFGKSTYTIKAHVSLPARPEKKKKVAPGQKNDAVPPPISDSSDQVKDKKKVPLILLEPRVLEISVE